MAAAYRKGKPGAIHGNDIDAQQKKKDSEKEFLKAWFPKLDQESYIIPPTHYSTAHFYDDAVFMGLNIKEKKRERDVQNTSSNTIVTIDEYMKRVHYSMNYIKEESRDLMVIMMGAKGGMYKSIQTGTSDWPNKRSQDSTDTTFDIKRNISDLLVIHRDHGLLLGAVVPDNGNICGTIRNVVAYLNKAQDIVMKDILRGVEKQHQVKVTINKTILLPNLTRKSLEKQIENYQDLEQQLKDCLGVDPGKYCLCKEDIAYQNKPNEWTVNQKELLQWFTSCFRQKTEKNNGLMTAEVYRALVTGYAVPLTAVKISLSTQPRVQMWTAGHVAYALGEELNKIALFPDQVDLLTNSPDNNEKDVKILKGGPGTAKTILLLLKGVFWADNGCDTVFNLQTSEYGRAAALHMKYQLKKTVDRPTFKVKNYVMSKSWDTPNKCLTAKGNEIVETLRKKVKGSEDKMVHILADEVDGPIISAVFAELEQIPDCIIKLWAAGIIVEERENMTQYVTAVTIPLRCPPTVIREVEQAKDIVTGRVVRYTTPPVEPSCQGPAVHLKIIHDLSDGNKESKRQHTRDSPLQCEECGRRVAKMLLEVLHVDANLTLLIRT